MSIERGTVKETANGMVLIEAEPVNMCSSCSAKGACHTSSGKKRALWIENKIGAEKGDIIDFEIKEGNVIISSILIYLFPVIMLFTGIVFGIKYPPFLKSDPEASGAAIGIVLLVLSYAIIRLISKMLNKNRGFTPVIKEIVSKS